MAMKFTQIPTDTFEKLVLNAGILVDTFAPETGIIGNLLGATSGGISFASNPTYADYGADVDNAPNNMMELKKLTGYDPTMSGNFLTMDTAIGKILVGGATVSGNKIIPKSVLESTDFQDIWWIGDYSDVNTGENAGFLAIHLMNALNTAGIQITSSKDNKAQMAFEFHGHYSVAEQDTVPFEIYVKKGTK